MRIYVCMYRYVVLWNKYMSAVVYLAASAYIYEQAEQAHFVYKPAHISIYIIWCRQLTDHAPDNMARDIYEYISHIWIWGT